ncbi:DUF305 domain-containing protein [Rubrivirga sp.]|uniref:DUF305 domain-containing protein n=1 Tax=Rubrivirga sp. TaxID=1885344 RepID=UPI003B51A071
MTRSVLSILALAVAAGCAGPATEPTPAEPSTEASDLEALYWARQQEAQTRFTDADVRFMTGMIGHHAQALVMSAMAPRNGASPSIRTLAARIANAQRDEIETMQRWLRDRDQPVPEVHIEGTRLMIHMTGGESDGGMNHGGMDHGQMDHGMGHDHTSMPGMLTQARLDELDAARGAAFDRLFLTYMIQHHAGAVVMVEDLFEVDGAGQDEAAFKLASDVQVDQRTEIARMEQMLAALSDS